MGQGHTPNGNTVAHWKLDEAAGADVNAYDQFAESVAGVDLDVIFDPVASSTPTVAEIAHGPGADTEITMRYFDGVNYGFLADNGVSAATLQAGHTIMAWVYLPSLPGRQYVIAYTGLGEASSQNYQTSLRIEGSGAISVFWEMDTPVTGENVTVTQSAGTFVTTGLHHIAVVIKHDDVSPAVDFYLDGALQDSVSYSSSDVPVGGSGADWYIGQSGADSSFLRVGSALRSVAIYSAQKDATFIQNEYDNRVANEYLHTEDGDIHRHWPMNEQPDALDTSGNGAHLRLTSGSHATAASIYDDPDELGLSRVLDGTQQLVSFAHHPLAATFLAALQGDCSFEAWVRPHFDWESATERGIIIWGDPGPEDAPNNFIGLEIRNNYGVRFFMEHGAGLDSAFTASSAFAARDRFERMHIAATKVAATGVVKIYVNGVLVGTSGSQTNYDNGELGFFRVGLGPDEDPWYGQLDDIIVYDVVRSDAEILADYEAGIDTPAGSSLVYRMRAFDGTLARHVFWSSSSVDSGGVDYGGPGPLSDVVVQTVLGS